MGESQTADPLRQLGDLELDSVTLRIFRGVFDPISGHKGVGLTEISLQASVSLGE